jgi:protein-L-isoaspartate(D-aspartate) O-methyltransferase
MKPMDEEHFAILRRRMVEVSAIHADLISEELGKAALHERVLAVMLRVPRHHFVPVQLAPFAYHDTPLSIGFDKTISHLHLSPDCSASRQVIEGVDDNCSSSR